MTYLLLLTAVLPGLLVCYVIFRSDKYEHEPLPALVFCFLLGALLTFPAVYLEKWAHTYLAASGMWPFLQTLVLAFLVIALNEEVLKFLALRYAVFPRSFFNEPMDGIVYATMIAMGFATAENLVYADRFGLETVFLRAFTAIPAHLFFAIVQGYYSGLAKFKPAKRAYLLSKGLLIATFVHGIYDALILQRWAEWLFVLGTTALYLSLYYSSRLIREHQDNSPFRQP